jgi:hypothetical protein
LGWAGFDRVEYAFYFSSLSLSFDKYLIGRYRDRIVMTLEEARTRVHGLLETGKNYHLTGLTFGQITNQIESDYDIAFDCGYNTKKNDLDKVYARLEYFIQEQCCGNINKPHDKEKVDLAKYK